ncbi:hypothetical protein GCM10023231_18370 [Olivibacter ginsenosidimutans]|uniref:Phage protein n=1 Tax=Olivibacter ginsenosidimutans TaxID=1176537 RepID=A0ABP9B5A7_9SPHI
MEESFTININYQHAEHVFDTKILSLGYTYKVEVIIDGTVVYFEPDEERHYRAVVTNTENLPQRLTPELLKAIANYLEKQIVSQ